MTLLTKLEKLGPGDLPTPPSVALKIVHACSDPNVSSDQVATIVGSDTALLTELLRIVNSPFFGISQKVTSAKRAIVVMGNRSLRNLALCFTARESLRPDTIPELDSKSYWEEVLRRAVSARILSEAVKMDTDEAFTIGMLQDFGLLTMFLICPENGKDWLRLRDSNPDDRQFIEMEIFGATHDAVGGILAKNWNLPDQIIIPISHHHTEYLDDLTPELKKMTLVALCADWMAAVYTAADKRLALAKCHKLITDHFGLDEATLDKLMEKVPVDVAEAAEALGISVAEQLSYQEIVATANKQLIEQPISYEDQTQRIIRALEARETLANEIQKAYNHLAQLAFYDPLTTLVNRRRFEEVCKAEIGRHCRSGKNISLIVIDIDKFKDINDKYGHAFGDEVLKAIARVLTSGLRGSDVAGRLGGDEMCLLLPETGVNGGEITVNRLHKAIESLVVRKDNTEIKVTASFGGCTWHVENYDKDKLNQIMKSNNANNIMNALIEAADQAMYKSKQGGRNTTNWTTLNLGK